MPKILVTIDEEANVEVEAKGFKGSGCKAFTEAIEKSLGKVTADKKTAEFSQQQNAKNSVSH